MTARVPLKMALLMGNVSADDAEDVLDEYRAEVLAADGQAYPGQLAMLAGLVATLTAVAEHGDMPEVRKLLAEYAGDDAAARAEAKEKSSPARADATPDFFQPGHTYSCHDTWTFRVTTVAEDPTGQRAALGFIHGTTYGSGIWDPHGETSLDGWTDSTEAAAQ